MNREEACCSAEILKEENLGTICVPAHHKANEIN